MKLESPRLIIRSFTEADIPDYAAIVADPRVTKYLGPDGSPHSFEEAEVYVRDVMRREAETGLARYAVVRKSAGDLIGFCGFKDIGAYIDFGWRYKYKVWGRGYGTEAAKAVLNYGSEVLDLTDIIAGAAVENAASVKIIQKLGFNTPEYSLKNGVWSVKFRWQKPSP